MRTTTALLLLLALALPAVAMPHPCEAEVAQMKKDLDAIRDAVATIEGLRPSDNQRLVLAGAKDKYDLELRRMTAAQARCDGLVSPAVPAPAPAATAPVPALVPAPPAVAPVSPVSPATSVPSATPGTPCLVGCGKDTDCKGDRICVTGSCQDPPLR
jgi:hypothetical protein